MSPLFIKNSCIPDILERVIPMDIQAVTIFFLVFCRGTPSERIRRHETIHFQQYLETLVIGFFIIYAWDYIQGRRAGLDGWDTYLNLRAEREAWENDRVPGYLAVRKRWAWIRSKPIVKFSQQYGAEF